MLVLLGAAWPLASCTKLDDLSAPSCVYDLSPTSATFGNSNATATATVTTASTCAWTATTDSSWIAITGVNTPGHSGAGSGTVSYTVIPNSTPLVRVATLSIAGRSLTVIQESTATQCGFTVTPTSAAFAAAGGSGSVSIGASTGCGWTAVSGASWITITSDTSGNGSATVRYTVAANAATTSRTAALVVAGQTVTVSQAGR
jgi:hypothetical protein